MGESEVWVAVQDDIVDPCADAGLEPIAQRGQAWNFDRHLFHAQLRGLAHPDHAGDVQRARAHAALVAAAVEERGQAHARLAAADVEAADALGAVELVRGK